MGLRPLPSDAFRLRDEGTWAAKAAVIDAWGLPSRVLGDLDLNRRGARIEKPEHHPAFEGRHDVIERFRVGFTWQADDAGTSYWIPQGLTGDADNADDNDAGRTWLVVSWHNEHEAIEKGMRVSFVDAASGANTILYRNVLLVNPIAAEDIHRRTRHLRLSLRTPAARSGSGTTFTSPIRAASAPDGPAACSCSTWRISRRSIPHATI